ncbi:MAG TPA: hypothetical protein VNO81_03345 [Candidatus Nitrosotenuis sp.]|nr:hypothetical protein [Candidatus Nitrosotenuis sp.]
MTIRDRLKGLALYLAGSPVFWLLLAVGALVLFVLLFETPRNFRVNEIYHLF